MKKRIRNLVVTCLIISMLSPCFGVTAFATSGENTDMDDLDILISAHYFLDSDSYGESFWSDSISDIDIVPLYNTSGKITAYYVELAEGGYAVVNNNTENPTTIEFGEGNNPLIREILDNNSNPHIIYNNPLSLYDANNTTMTRSISDQPDLYDNYPDLQVKDSSLASMLSEQKDIIESTPHIVPYGDGDYGFINWSDMPSGSYTSDNIPYSGTSWVITGDFDDIASDHCGATAVTNLANYFANQGYSKLKKSSNRNTFIAVHNIVGNGPVMTIADKAKKYFSNCGYTLQYSSVGTFTGIKDATKKDRPCGILLADGIVKWHWILSVGYRDYNSGGDYIRIMDGWNRNVNRFYKPGSGSLWISATQYWI
ncbi:hypothetical protein INF30_12270 [Lachnospiraceae bacterium DSM 108991]|uniref:Peptidase C39-like domain-containing protein n=1 Tax=Claveliimonas monacensis TaxID=2779351 RepID=A0ABR9RM24_9FIRM|nr:hypothetical protein [Claveliimonas monacensis]MBE5064029.1 hypothetical protein [Claveliimonas monacensis]